MALTHRLTHGPTERQARLNLATRPLKVRPRIGKMASQGRAELDYLNLNRVLILDMS